MVVLDISYLDWLLRLFLALPKLRLFPVGLLFLFELILEKSLAGVGSNPGSFSPNREGYLSGVIWVLIRLANEEAHIAIVHRHDRGSVSIAHPHQLDQSLANFR